MMNSCRLHNATSWGKHIRKVVTPTGRNENVSAFGAILFPATKTPHKKSKRTITTM